jgi:hypothetical protein
MQDIPANLGGYKLIVSEEPSMKMREDRETGQMVPVVDREGVTQFVVSLFAKPIPAPGALARKGEEIKVTLSTDPGEGFEEGTRVELINAVVNLYSMPDKQDPRKIASAGLWFKAAGMKPAARRSDKAA